MFDQVALPKLMQEKYATKQTNEIRRMQQKKNAGGDEKMHMISDITEGPMLYTRRRVFSSA